MVVKAALAVLVVGMAALAGCIATDDPDPALQPVAVIDSGGAHHTVGNEVVLDATRSHDPQGGTLTHQWSVAGETNDGPILNHTFKETGNHTVALTVTNPQGAQDTTTTTLTIAETEYEQHVWFNWDTHDLDVLLLGIHDPVVGGAIQAGIDAWQTGIAQLAPELAENLTIRVYWPATGGVPPTDFEPNIYFVPVGYMASSNTPFTGTCTAFAPVGYLAPDMTDTEEFYFTAAHEFGHCLGLSHVFHEGNESEPRFDLLGSGSVHNEWGRSCPSNLNIEILRMIFNGEQGTVVMPSTQYEQTAC